MKLGLQVGFDGPVAHEQDWLHARNIGFIRCDVQHSDGDALAALLADGRSTDLDILWIARGPQLQHFLPGERVELVNEPTLDYPDRSALTPQEYAEEWNRYAIEAQERGVRVYAGCVHNIYTTTLDWMRAVWSLMHERPMHASFHRYPEDSGPLAPHRGFASRDAELDALRAITGDVPMVMSECGYHLGPRSVKYGPFGLRRRTERWTESEQRDFWQWEADFYAQHNLEAAVCYQIASGPGDTPNDLFGLRRPDGSDRPIVDVFRGWRE